MRRSLLLAVLALAGCAGNDKATYDAAALRQARVVASTKSGWLGWTKPVSVGRAAERKVCQARTYHADPCVVVPTVHRVRKLTVHGEVYVWLAREQGRWTVVDTDYFTPEIRLTIEGGQPAPPWVSP